LRPSAFITGISGQDGSYLAELLLSKGYCVAGSSRDPQAALQRLPEAIRGQVRLLAWDMCDEDRLAELLAELRPTELYNLAAYSSGAGMYDDPVGIGEINGLVVARLLEAIRAVDPRIRICQASSSEMFGDPGESPQSESTPCLPRSPYGAAKLYAHAMVRIYRRRYDLFACSAILFNHESPRRGLAFVTRKVAREVARIKLGRSDSLVLGNLDARRDWGFAADYMRAMWLMLQADRPEDYVVASGQTHSIRELCACAFGHVGLDYRAFVRESAADYRPIEPVQLVGDPARLMRLGWTRAVGFEELVHMMVDAELQLLGGSGVPGV
jgi:GDPmannose 4,6-dehydratase